MNTAILSDAFLNIIAAWVSLQHKTYIYAQTFTLTVNRCYRYRTKLDVTTSRLSWLENAYSRPLFSVDDFDQ